MTALLRFSTCSSNRKAGVRGVVRLEILKKGVRCGHTGKVSDGDTSILLGSLFPQAGRYSVASALNVDAFLN